MRQLDRLQPIIASEIISTPALPSAKTCRLVLLMRWAHEKNDLNLVRQMLPDRLTGREFWPLVTGDSFRDPTDLDVENVSMELTYREAMDLRWFLGALPQAQSPARRRRR